jgi:ribosomal protein S18 acetylase RimI-like enzyme
MHTRRGFIDAYKEAFSGLPYNEHYTDQQVIDDAWLPNLNNGMVMVVTDEEQLSRIIGFGCAVPFDKAPDDVKEFLECLHRAGRLPNDFGYQHAWYMSELGVLKEYRGHGAAWELVKRRMWSIDYRGGTQFFMRTAAVNSPSKPMYLKMGAHELPDLQDVSNTSQVLDNGSQANNRVYLWGNTREVASNIDDIQSAGNYIPFATD